MTREEVDEAIRLHDSGRTWQEVADGLHYGLATLHKAMRRLGIAPTARERRLREAFRLRGLNLGWAEVAGRAGYKDARTARVSVTVWRRRGGGKMGQGDIDRAVAMHRQGCTFREIGDALRLSAAYVRDKVREVIPYEDDSNRPHLAAELRRQGHGWADIARMVGYQDAHSANQSVRSCGLAVPRFRVYSGNLSREVVDEILAARGRREPIGELADRLGLDRRVVYNVERGILPKHLQGDRRQEVA